MVRKALDAEGQSAQDDETAELIAAAVLPGGYIGCDSECDPPARRGGKIWCRGGKDCKAPCSCHLFRLRKRQPGEDDYDPQWEHVGPSRKKFDEDTDYMYRCWCVRKADDDDSEDVTVQLRDIVDKDYAAFSSAELAASPVHALLGLSQADATALDKAFGVCTVRDLAELKYVRWAQAIVALADGPVLAAATPCTSIPDLNIDEPKLVLKKKSADEDWLLPLDRYLKERGKDHCSKGSCSSGTCVGKDRAPSSYELLSETDTTVTVKIKARIVCECSS